MSGVITRSVGVKLTVRGPTRPNRALFSTQSLPLVTQRQLLEDSLVLLNCFKILIC